MPRSSRPSATSAPDPGTLLEGLRKALAGPKLLNAADGLFATTAKGKQAAQAAVDLGYLTKRTETLPPKGRAKTGKEVVVGELTDKGREHVLEVDSPKAVLEALLPAVQALSAPPPPGPNVEAFQYELREATAACVKAIEDGFGKMQKAVEAAFGNLEQKVVKTLPPPATGRMLDPTSLLDSLRTTLARVTASPEPPTLSPAAPVPLDLSAPETDFGRRAAQHMVFAWQEAEGSGRSAIERGLLNVGVQPIGRPGEQLDFVGRLHTSNDAVFPGDPVEIVQPGWLLLDTKGEYLLAKAVVKPLPRSS